MSLTAGLAIGFGACSIAGHLVPETMEPFTRFHLFVGPDTFYYPTVRSAWNSVLMRVDRKKTVVVLGGSSVPYGLGQVAGHTLADRLQDKLGPGFTVINLAMRSGDVAGMGLFIAESLKARGYKVIYIADVNWGVITPTGRNPVYDYVYWQYRGEKFAQSWGPRDDFAKPKAWTEVAVAQRSNSIFRFINLWTYIGHEQLFTVFHPYTPEFWKPRKEYTDNEVEVTSAQGYARHNNGIEKDFLIRFSTPIGESQWKETVDSWNATIPDSLKKSTVLIVCRKSPFYDSQIVQSVRDSLEFFHKETRVRAQQAGFSAIEICKDFDQNDYVDSSHLSPAGAVKAAILLAGSVINVAGVVK